MINKIEIAVSAVLLAVAAALFAVTFSDQFDVPTFGGDVGPAFAPRVYLLVWMGLAATTLVQAVRAGARDAVGANPRKLLPVALIACATSYAMTEIGFVFATVPGFFLFCWAFGYRKPVLLVPLSVAGPLLIWAVFTFVFELPLPRSPWLHMM